MLIQLMLSLFLGIITGALTGLTPGIHINLIGVSLVSLSSSVFITPIYLVTFITSLAITHTFIDFIPSIFLGCPDTDTELSILPGHELLKKGHGYQAILLTNYGSLIAIIILALITIPSIILIPKINSYIQPVIPYFLITASISLILFEKNKFSALIVLLLTGTLGFLVLNIKQLSEPLLPLLTGLFGSSTIIISIKNKTEIPKQKIKNPKTKFIRPTIGALIASPMCSFLPGLGSGQAAVLGNLVSRTNKKGFLVLLGITNTLVMGFSFISLYAIEKTRTGAALAIKEITGAPSIEILILIIITALISGIISFILTKKFAEIASRKITKINYTKLSIITLIIIIIITIIVSGFSGLIILIISTLTGIYCISLKVKRTNMMNCLLIPTIIYYLF
jgi:putative membrane protein